MRRAAAIALTLLLPTLTGCWQYTRGQARPPQAPPLPADAWPPRDPEAVRPLLAATPREVFAYRVREGVDPASLTPDERERVEKPSYVVTYSGMHGPGLLRLYERPWRTDEEKKPTVETFFDYLILGFVPNAQMVSSRTVEARERATQLANAMAAPPDPAPAPPPGGPSHVETLDAVERCYLDAGLPIRIPPPRAGGEKARGLLIHLHAIAGNPYEPKVTAEFRRRGWAEVDIKTETAIESPIPEEWRKEVVALRVEARDLARQIYTPLGPSPGRKDFEEQQRRALAHPLFPRYHEVTTRLADLTPGGFQACDEGECRAAGVALAAQVDNALAGTAYGVEAVLDYVARERPDLRGIPVVLIGFSAGALATPTAAARVHDQVNAVILVGGGCDLFRISQESVFSNGGITVRCGREKAPPASIDLVDRAYLDASRLDPYHTAPLIADLPILQLHASRDTWVPAKTGRVLTERLAHPERLTIWGGHEFLFYFLSSYATWIADWAERAVGIGKNR